MARGRMIAKSLSTSRKFGRLHEVAGRRAEFCQSLYPLLVAHADDFGRLSGDSYTVKHAIIPTSPRKEHDISAALAALHLVGLIVWYEADGDKCIQITKFDEHQQGLHKRIRSAFPETPGNSRNPPEIPGQEKGTEGKGIEENKSTNTAAQPRLVDKAKEPNGDNYAVIQVLAHSVLDDLGSQVEDEADFVEAVKCACALRDIDYGAISGNFDVVHRACASVWFKARTIAVRA